MTTLLDKEEISLEELKEIYGLREGGGRIQTSEGYTELEIFICWNANNISDYYERYP